MNKETPPEMPAECSIELRVRDRPTVLRMTADHDQSSIEELIGCQRYSVLQKLLRITAQVLEFIHILKVNMKYAIEDDTASTKPNHTQTAELLWVRAAQKQLSQDPHFEKLKGQFEVSGGVVDAYLSQRCHMVLSTRSCCPDNTT